VKRIQIICGHYGSGKSEYAVNLALALSEIRDKVYLADMDIVNPYFRSYEREDILKEKGIKVITTSCGGVADIPALNPEVNTIFQDSSITGVIDVGGDPIGARVLARFAPMIKSEEVEVILVVNANRPETKTLEQVLAYKEAIEREAKQQITCLVNNTHLCGETDKEQILKGAELVKEVAEATGLTIKHHVVLKELLEEVELEDCFPIAIYMKKPWENI